MTPASENASVAVHVLTVGFPMLLIIARHFLRGAGNQHFLLSTLLFPHRSREQITIRDRHGTRHFVSGTRVFDGVSVHLRLLRALSLHCGVVQVSAPLARDIPNERA